MREHVKNPHAIALGRLGGVASSKVKSEAKAVASRANGRKGGRKKFTALTPLPKGVTLSKGGVISGRITDRADIIVGIVD